MEAKRLVLTCLAAAVVAAGVPIARVAIADDSYAEHGSKVIGPFDEGGHRHILIRSEPVAGPLVAQTGSDPNCADAVGATCRKVCGNTPKGTRAYPGNPFSENFDPPGYARFVDPFEVYDQGDHDRVCRRFKHWGDNTNKVFNVAVRFKAR
jgi:hypothetical protein